MRTFILNAVLFLPLIAAIWFLNRPKTSITIGGVTFYRPLSVIKNRDTTIIVSRMGCSGPIEHGWTSEGGPLLDWDGNYYGYSLYKIYMRGPIENEHVDTTAEVWYPKSEKQ